MRAAVPASRSTTRPARPPDGWVPARGIDIIELEANQAVAVPLVDTEGAWIDEGARNAPLVRTRDTLLRVHWTVADGWVPHEVLARLTLLSGGQQPTVYESQLQVSGDSSPASLDGFFALAADNDDTEPGIAFELELFEPEDLSDPALPELTNVVPTGGPADIGFRLDPMHLELVLVPIHYNFGGADELPVVSERELEDLRNRLFERFPVQTLELTLHEPLEYEAELTQLGQLLPEMADLKLIDGASADAYYMGLVACDQDCFIDGDSGIALLADDTEADSLSRVAAVMYFDAANSFGEIIRQLGHNHGLLRVSCPNGDPDPGADPNYPYLDGVIGVWGFGIRQFQLHEPGSTYDFMSLCTPAWVSDWTYAKLYERVQVLSSW